MYEIRQYNEGKYNIYELTNTGNDSWIKVAPERGGMLIGFGVEGEELFFLNKDTFQDPGANVRGGNPILFPISGQLENGEYMWEGKKYKMRNHGLARTSPWEVDSTNLDDEASITLRLESTEEMKKSFPFDFEVLFTYILKGSTLNILQEYINKSDSPMPFYPGFHPYFRSTNKKIHYQTDAKSYLDYNDMKTHAVGEHIDITDKKESIVLLDSVKREIGFELTEPNKRVLMTYGDEFKYIYIWSEKGQDFVCVEPWIAKTDELNRKEELILISPGESLKTFLTISVVS